MAQPDSAKYLGCHLYATGDLGKELGRSLGDAARPWQKPRLFWKSAACSPKWKLVIYDAAIRAKLVYRMSAMALTQAQMSRVDACQLRGLRNILRFKHTYLARENAIRKVSELANAHRFPEGGSIKPFPAYYERYRTCFATPGDPCRALRFSRSWSTPVPRQEEGGRPRQHWTLDCYSQAWRSVLGGAGPFMLGRPDIEKVVVQVALERRF